jgi:hypothetical protein
MLTLCKATIVSVGLLAGLAASAHAQSVAAPAPDGIAPPAQTAHSPVFGSTQSFYPKPGGGAVWKEERYQPLAQSATGPRRYADPKPN